MRARPNGSAGTRAATPAVRLLAAAALTLSGCDFADGGDGNRDADDALVTAEIGPAGGVLAASAGSLDKLALRVPPGALSRNVGFRADHGRQTFTTDFRAAGVVVELQPDDISFAVPGELTLRYDPQLAGSTDDLVVRRRDSQGVVTTLAPPVVDTVEATVTVAVTQLGTFWAAVPVGSAQSQAPSDSAWTRVDRWIVNDGAGPTEVTLYVVR